MEASVRRLEFVQSVGQEQLVHRRRRRQDVGRALRRRVAFFVFVSRVAQVRDYVH